MAAETVGDLEFYRLIRARLEHEDGLIVGRLSWLMASESFLFTAYAIGINGLSSSQTGPARLLRMVPFVGIACSGLIFVGILAAVRAMGWLKGLLRARIADEAALGLPPFATPEQLASLGLIAPLILPWIFVAAWVYLVL